MAVVLVKDCPHCGAENTGFALQGESEEPGGSRMWRLLFTCNRCRKPICAIGVAQRSEPPSRLIGDMREFFVRVDTWPKKPVPNAPAHCPEAIANAFLQADTTIRRAGFSESTVAMDRRALEIATKRIAPDLADETLYRRIELLAERHLLTPALKDWAHELRTLGNEALHEEDGVSPEEARQTHELTRYVLTYLFTLPEQVRASREAREG